MNIQLVEKETEGILLIEGRLDSNTAREAEKIFDEVTGRFLDVTLDIGKLQYISSAGLRLVLRMHMGLKKKGGRLTVKNANPMVLEVFEMVGFTTLCEFV